MLGSMAARAGKGGSGQVSGLAGMDDASHWPLLLQITVHDVLVLKIIRNTTVNLERFSSGFSH